MLISSSQRLSTSLGIKSPSTVPVDSVSCKIEGRQPIHSWRLTPKIVLDADLVDSKMNGEIEKDRNETVKISTKAVEKIHKSKDNKQSSKSTGTNLSCSDLIVRPSDSEETKQLKSLLLLHLDLIQQQQEFLLAKDRIISSLKSENETLKCRLDRMTRRMSLAGRKRGTEKVASSDLTGTQQVEPSDDKAANNKPTKRKGSFEPRNLSKRFAAEGSKLSSRLDGDEGHSDTEQRPRVSCNRGWPRRHTSADQVLAKGQPLTRQKGQCYKEPITPSRSSYNFDNVSEAKRSREVQIRPVTCEGDRLIMRTDNMYYSMPYWDLDPPDPDEGERIKQVAMIEVPTWRVHPVANRYVIEGTENMEDEIYIKRHQKPEADERRRKRWDLQRSREQALYERLKQGLRSCGPKQQPGTVRERDDTVSSFFPDPETINYIEVCDTVPVTAFGYPLPDLTTAEFEIPWLDEYKKEERSKPGRVRRR